jgi:hypothetical protein
MGLPPNYDGKCFQKFPENVFFKNTRKLDILQEDMFAKIKRACLSCPSACCAKGARNLPHGMWCVLRNEPILKNAES